MSEQILTEEQKAFLEECEDEFVYRFTERDEEFMKVYEANIPSSPIMCPWYGRCRFNRNYPQDNRRNNFNRSSYSSRQHYSRDDGPNRRDRYSRDEVSDRRDRYGRDENPLKRDRYNRDEGSDTRDRYSRY